MLFNMLSNFLILGSVILFFTTFYWYLKKNYEFCKNQEIKKPKAKLIAGNAWKNCLFNIRPIHSKFQVFIGRNNVFTLKLRDRCVKEYLYFSCMTEQNFRKLESIVIFAPMWHPKCTNVYRLEMQIKLCLIFWILDDHTECDWGDGGREFGRAKLLWSQVLECLDKLIGKPVIGEHWRPYIWALFGVSEAILSCYNNDQKLRYINAWRKYTYGCINESEYYIEKKWKTLDEMFEIREDSSGSKPVFAMIEYMNEITLTEDQWCDKNLQKMISLACKWVVILNDIFGFEAELKECGNNITKMRNTIALLILIEGMEFQSAVDKATDLLLEVEAQIFECQDKFLSSQIGDQIVAARHYITYFNYACGGNYAVHHCCERYNDSIATINQNVFDAKSKFSAYFNYN